MAGVRASTDVYFTLKLALTKLDQHRNSAVRKHTGRFTIQWHQYKSQKVFKKQKNADFQNCHSVTWDETKDEQNCDGHTKDVLDSQQDLNNMTTQSSRATCYFPYITDLPDTCHLHSAQQYSYTLPHRPYHTLLIEARLAQKPRIRIRPIFHFVSTSVPVVFLYGCTASSVVRIVLERPGGYVEGS
jgi:hypothetical protein